MLRRNRDWRMPMCASPLTSRDSHIYAPSKERTSEVNARIYEPSGKRTFAALLDGKTEIGSPGTWTTMKEEKEKERGLQVAFAHL